MWNSYSISTGKNGQNRYPNPSMSAHISVKKIYLMLLKREQI